MRYGCQTGAIASKPFVYDWGTVDRCPLAVLRDSSPDDVASIHWSISMAVSKRQGSLGAYIAPNTLSARGEALIEVAEDTIAAREVEALKRAGERG